MSGVLLAALALSLAEPAELPEGELTFALPAGMRGAPIEMPRAEAYLVSGTNGTRRLEDRYNELDLWTAHVLCGRWSDASGRILLVSRLDAVVPKFIEGTLTRTEYARRRVPAERDDDRLRLQAVDALSPVAPEAGVKTRRSRRRHLRDIEYWQGTNTSAIVCAFLPEGSPNWFVASLQLSAEDDAGEAFEWFDGEFLDAVRWSRPPKERDVGKGRPALDERALLRADAFHSVTNYAGWHAAGSEEIVVIDNLASDRDFIAALTNDLPRLRRLYAETVPSPLDGSNTLCVARIYATKADYLRQMGADYAWTAAVWSPRYRELVAYLSPAGEAELLKTIRHEAFHQYLAYATSMIPASPWFNEGYAEYFEHIDDDAETFGFRDEAAAGTLDDLAGSLPALLAMDYDAFYSGSAAAKRQKYKLARSIAVFLEQGAKSVRFEPFKDLKKNYVEALLRTQDMRAATSAAFGSEEGLRLFVAEWKRFWSNR